MKKLLLSIALFCCWTLSSSAATIMTYQGRLKESNLPVTGTRSFSFSICNSLSSPAGCTPSPDGAQPFEVANGLFKSTFTLPTVDLSAGPWYLEVLVGTPPASPLPLSPRELFTFVPYSVYSLSASTASALAAASGPGVSASTNVIVAGSLAAGDAGVQLSTDAAVEGYAVLQNLSGTGVQDIRVAVEGRVYSQTTDQADAMAGGNFEAEVPAGKNGMLVGVRTRNAVDAAGSSLRSIGLMVDALDNKGSIVDTYGVYIASQTGGTQAHRPYALYSEDANAASYFAGNVGIGASAPAYALVVSSASGDVMWVSSYAVHALKFVGDGSGLSGVTGASGTDPNALHLTGGTMSGTIDMAGNYISGVSTITLTDGSLSIIPAGTSGNNYNYGISIGSNTYNNYSNGVGLGHGTYNNYSDGVGVGYGAYSNNSYGIGVGLNAYSNYNSGVGVGANASANYNSGVGVGANASGNANYAVGIGAYSQNNQGYGSALGAYSYAASSAAALGAYAKANAYQSVAIGNGTVNNSTGTASFGMYGIYTSSDVFAITFHGSGAGLTNVPMPAVSTITISGDSLAIVPPGTGGSNYGYGISIGSASYDNYSYGVGVGYYAASNNTYGVGVGYYTASNNTYGVGVGDNANNNYTYGVGVGADANNNYTYGVGVGGNAYSNYGSGVGLGYNAHNNYVYGVGVGANAYGNANYAVGVGAYSHNNGTFGAALGAYSYANSSGTALGSYAQATAPNSVAIGNGTVNNSTGTASFGMYGIYTSSDVFAVTFHGNGSGLTGIGLPAVSTITIAGDSLAIVPAGTGGSNNGNGISIGSSTYNNYNSGVGLGYTAYNNYNSGVGVGNGAYSNYTNGVGVGVGASGNNTYGVGVGALADNNYNYGVGVGAYSQNNQNFASAFGAYSYAASSGTALGSNARATALNSVAIGNGTVNNSTGTASFGGYGVYTASDVFAAAFHGDGSHLSGIMPAAVSTITIANDSLAIVPAGTGGSNYAYGISIGSDTYDNYSYGVGMGYDASNNYNSGVGVGFGASGNNLGGVGVGSGASGNSGNGVGVGVGALNNSGYGVGVGASAVGNSGYGVGVGAYSQNNQNFASAFGAYSYANSSGTALGSYARAMAPNSVAIGNGTVNNSTGTASFGNYSITSSSNVMSIGSGTSSFVVNNGNVGINYSSPTMPLIVAAPTGGYVLGLTDLSFAQDLIINAVPGNQKDLFINVNNAQAGIAMRVANATALRVSSTSYVGIGTASPSYRLHVSSGAGESGTIMAVSTGTTNLFWVAGDGAHATTFYGNGSGLTNVTATDSSKVLKAGDMMTGALDMGGNPLLDVSSLTIVGDGLRIATSPYSGANGIFITSVGAIQTLGTGSGSIAGSTRGAGAVDLQTSRSSSAQIASGSHSVIGGGVNNAAESNAAVIAGGDTNDVVPAADHSVIGGGYKNTVQMPFSMIGGGYFNIISQSYAVIAGGQDNSADADYASVSGGYMNAVASGANGAFIGGGEGNSVNGSYAGVGGGSTNTASGPWAFVGAGIYNQASGMGSFVGAGKGNNANGDYSSVPGGLMNSAVGQYSFAAGYLSSSTAMGTFTWKDSSSSPSPLMNNVTDQVMFEAAGGFWVSTGPVLSDPGLYVTNGNKVGIGTEMPSTKLEVDSLSGGAISGFSSGGAATDAAVYGFSSGSSNASAVKGVSYGSGYAARFEGNVYMSSSGTNGRIGMGVPPAAGAMTMISDTAAADPYVLRVGTGTLPAMLNVSSVGVVSMPLQSMSEGRFTGATLTAASWTPIPGYPSVLINTQYELNPSTGKFTALTPGLYLVSGTVTQSVSTTTLEGVGISKNNALQYMQTRAGAGDASNDALSISYPVWLVAGDYVQLMVYSAAGSPVGGDMTVVKLN